MLFLSLLASHYVEHQKQLGLMWRLKKKKKWERERERGRKREEWASIVLLGCHPSIQNHPPTTIPSHYYDNEQLWKIFRQNLNSAQIDFPPPPDLSIGNHPLPPIPSSSLCSDFRVYFSLPTPLRIQKSLISSNLHTPPPPLPPTWLSPEIEGYFFFSLIKKIQNNILYAFS